MSLSKASLTGFYRCDTFGWVEFAYSAAVDGAREQPVIEVVTKDVRTADIFNVMQGTAVLLGLEESCMVLYAHGPYAVALCVLSAIGGDEDAAEHAASWWKDAVTEEFTRQDVVVLALIAICVLRLVVFVFQVLWKLVRLPMQWYTTMEKEMDGDIEEKCSVETVVRLKKQLAIVRFCHLQFLLVIEKLKREMKDAKKEDTQQMVASLAVSQHEESEEVTLAEMLATLQKIQAKDSSFKASEVEEHLVDIKQDVEEEEDLPANPEQNRNEAAETNREEQPGLPFRRIRQPRRTPEIIVIEEDDEEDEEEEVEEGQEVARAPPDVVLDEEEASQNADVVMVDPPTEHVETTDLLEKEADLQTGLLLYFCLGGAPDLDTQWTNCFTQLNADECVEMPRALRFQRRYSFLQSFPVYLTQCVLQAVILNGQNVADGSDNSASRSAGALNDAIMRAKFNDVVKDIHLSWAKALNELLTKKAAGIAELTSEKLDLTVNPAGLSSSADKVEVIYDWSRRQESVMWILARKLHYGSFLPAMKCNVDASPAVYLFTVMFDVRIVTSECPQYGTFRLNAFGGKVIAYLWNHTLKKLPYVFFADWPWLEDQSTKEKLPALAFCHVLASILLWNSAIDHHSLTNQNIYAAAVKHILPKLYVGGQAIYESVESTSLLLAECESTYIELIDLDGQFASILGLDGFFEVTEAIQNNMLAVATATTATST